MSEAQFLNVVLTTLPTMIFILIGILLNNARLNDLKDALCAEIKVVDERLTGTGDLLRAEMQTVRAEVQTETRTIRTEMEKNQSEMLHRFGDLDTRLSRIENSLGVNRG